MMTRNWDDTDAGGNDIHKYVFDDNEEGNENELSYRSHAIIWIYFHFVSKDEVH